ncbi:Chalcone-flavanone isomerase family protein [Melia azedarach]|uniref:Chalcone-flavanone isomerase family protein n=1 Tax=Melia azedarach TaxID=155640 RepID=A0ACC1XS33_MELAZ|nr:Chalcone-flavanone isomerase family protein [Melia azedarach]
METPSSTRRVTRSQTLAAHNNTANNTIPISRKIEDSEKSVSKSRQKITKQQQDRSALIDITNDSPIVGVATGGLETPSSAMTKQRTIRFKNKTPGSGEALLRCQVKTLLQKVEEEAELSKLSLESRPFLHLQGFVNSPMRLLAPTPANTPQVSNLSDANNGLASMNASPVIDEQMISQVVSDIFDGKIQESVESEKNLTRSLLLDFSEKSETFNSSECKSVVTDQDQKGKSDCKEKCADDDDSSVWSIQGNASVHDEDADEQVEKYYDDNSEENEAEEKYGGLLDELCEDMSRISMNNEKITAEFTGKHTRFLYDSDDEIVEEQTEANNNSGNVLRFKGLPTPKGKHLRFAIEEEENDD